MNPKNKTKDAKSKYSTGLLLKTHPKKGCLGASLSKLEKDRASGIGRPFFRLHTSILYLDPKIFGPLAR